jgi:hypothetical protein
MKVFMMAFSEFTMGSFRMSVPSLGDVNHPSNSWMSISTCCSSSVIGNSFTVSGIRLMEATAMNKNEVIVTDVAVLTSDEVVRTLEHIEAFSREAKPAEALTLLYWLLNKVRRVRRAISIQPLRTHAKYLTTLLQLEEVLWSSAAALNDVITSSAN